MSSVEDLIKDHYYIRKAIHGLEVILRKAQKENTLSLYFFKSFINFAKKFIDNCHHGKEEKCFFPCLEKLGMPKEGGPIGVMLKEHELGRTLIKKIEEKINLYEKGEIKVDELLNACYEYIDLMNNHMFKEENILFRIGKEIINENDDKETIECQENVEKHVGEHENLIKLAEELENPK